jgi:hypothetical protein
MLGRPDAAPDCDCANDTSGSIPMRKGIVNFIGYPLDSVLVFLLLEKSTTVLFPDKKNYSSAKLFIKKFLASINICSRLWVDKVSRAAVSTPAILGNNS